MNDKTLHDKLIDLSTSIKGLRTEVESWRKHTSSSSDFIMIELEALTRSLDNFLKELKRKIKETQ
jgi:hypothetical protein